ncbi:MAG: thioredoxin domain-containing protein [Candidatus Obscuribacter sp.]|nr:hypothetical protein [Candidatus Melainabacteria bacterium]MDX1988760.1 thioredoxin domain-containing protein [Candidatus Obscuribacter sp.]
MSSKQTSTLSVRAFLASFISLTSIGIAAGQAQAKWPFMGGQARGEEGEVRTKSLFIKEINDRKFNTQVLKSEAPVVVTFYSDMCEACRALDPIMDRIAGSYQGKVKFYRILVDDNPRSSQRFNIKKVPTVAVFKGGKLMGGSVGYTPGETLKERIDQAL